MRFLEATMFKDRVVELTTTDEVTSFLNEYPTSVIFKAGTCHKTMQGFGFVQEKLEPREDLMVGLIRVVESRPASNLVAELTGLRHESPQVIIFQDGQPVFEANNWSITPEVLEQPFTQLPQGETVARTTAPARSDLSPYMQLLESFLDGSISDSEFEQSYTYMFRDDASLRSREEVEVLNSIFGDVDQHMAMRSMMDSTSDTSQVRARAEKAYRSLQALV
jgi:bacillithiol system protein YtxJ